MRGRARRFSGETGRKRETGENWRGRGSRSRARFWPLLRFRLAEGLTACDLFGYNAREIDIREDRGKAVYIVSGDIGDFGLFPLAFVFGDYCFSSGSDPLAVAVFCASVSFVPFSAMKSNII